MIEECHINKKIKIFSKVLTRSFVLSFTEKELGELCLADQASVIVFLRKATPTFRRCIDGEIVLHPELSLSSEIASTGQVRKIIDSKGRVKYYFKIYKQKAKLYKLQEGDVVLVTVNKVE